MSTEGRQLAEEAEPRPTNVEPVVAGNRKRLLAAWMDEDHLRLYLQGQMLGFTPEEQRDLLAEHQETRDRFEDLDPINLTRTPPQPLSEEEQEWVEEVERQDLFQQTFGGNPDQYVFGRVPLDQILTSQVSLKGTGPVDLESEMDLLRWCIPKEFGSEGIITNFGQPTPGDRERFVLVTDDPSAQLNLAPTDEGLTFQLRPNLNWVQLVDAGDAYVVKNGNHRIAALAAAGYEEVPAVIVNANLAGDFIPDNPGFFDAAYLSTLDRPPLVTDWLDDDLTVTIPHPDYRRMFEVRYEVTETKVPTGELPIPEEE